MTTTTNINKFNFFVPLDLEKASDGKGGTLVKIKGVASSESEDSDGETLIPAGFDFGPLLKTGFLNWNHQATKSAKAICGEPTSAKIINNGKDFYIEGFLYPNAQGKEVAELAETLEKYSPNRRLGFSIEGQAIERGCAPEFLDKSQTVRNPNFDPSLWKKVTKARITGVAITQSPKNPNTLMSIVKGNVDNFYVEDEESDLAEIEKGGVGSGRKPSKGDIIHYNKTIGGVKRTLKGTHISTDKDGKYHEVRRHNTDDIDYISHQDITHLDRGEGIEKIEKEGTTEKAMDTVAMAPAMPESVEHKTKSSVGLLLNKSDVYIQIYDRYTTDITKAKEIFNFISSVNEKLFKMKEGEKITPEVLQKSFEILDGLVKASENEEVNKVQEKEEQSEEGKGAPATSEEETEEVKKANACATMAKGLLASGMAQGDVVKAMTAVGVDLTMAETACQACISQASNLENNGGDIKKEEAPIIKSEEPNVLLPGEPVADLIKGLEASFSEGISDLSKGISDRFSAVGSILKSMVDERAEIQASLDALQKGFDEQAEELEKIKETPISSKSTRSARAIERFEKGNPEGEVYNVNSKQDVANLSNRLFQEVSLIKSRGNEDMILEKAVMDLEISKATDYNALMPRLRQMGISLVRE